MIYLDNAATTLQKPPEVGQAMLVALQTAGNPGRGAHEPTLHAARLVYGAREALAELFHAESPAASLLQPTRPRRSIRRSAAYWPWATMF